MFNFGKKITRFDYSPKKYGLASQNEPAQGVTISCDCRLYPDMKRAYDKFAQLFHIDDRVGFILTNGGENAMKQALLAIRPKNLTWFEPTWKMPEVFCAALDIKPRKKKFKYDAERKIIYTPKLYRGGDCFYSNYGITNAFEYYMEDEYSIIGLNYKFNYTIIDVTYQDFMKMSFSKFMTNEHKNTIIVGSFDKLVGCGLRLGFVLFNKKVWNERMQLQREQYINMCAYNWLLNITRHELFEMPKNPIREYLLKMNNKQLPSNWSLTDNFITIPSHIKAKPSLNPEYFEIDGQQFTKFGMPSNKYEKQEIYRILRKELQL